MFQQIDLASYFNKNGLNGYSCFFFFTSRLSSKTKTKLLIYGLGLKSACMGHKKTFIYLLTFYLTSSNIFS